MDHALFQDGITQGIDQRLQLHAELPTHCARDETAMAFDFFIYIAG